MSNQKPVAPLAVQRYWNAVSNILRIQSQEIAGLINHLGTRGTADENSIMKVLSQVLPPSTRVSNGEIIDSKGNVSAQMDALVLSNTSHPILFAQTPDEMMFPVESVLLAIEVKGNLSKADVHTDIVGKIKKHRKLHSPEQPPPVFAVFAHKAASNPRTVASWFHELPDDVRPEFFLINDSAMFGALDSNSPGKYEVVMPFAPREGEDDTQTAAQIAGGDLGFWKPIGGPLSDCVRVDHGAGMLLFLKAILSVLGGLGYSENVWLDRYLDQVDSKIVRYDAEGEPTIKRA